MNPAVEAFPYGPEHAEDFAALNGRSDPANDVVSAGTDCLLLRADGEVAARATYGTAHDLTGAPGSSGWVGHYEARNADAGAALLEEAVRRLAGRGVARVLGPMNGSTWHRYRLALPDPETDAGPPFPGEPRNPPDYPAHFERAGFRIVQTYESRVARLAEVEAVRAPQSAAGVAVRPFDPARFDETLDALFDVSLDAFRDNVFYAPIGRDTFRALYEPFRGRLDPALVMTAESGGGIVGYALTYPDGPGPSPERCVFKTLAVRQAARGLRVGSLLMDAVRAAALARGFTSLIYALMHADNLSRAMSARRDAKLLRRYALWQWTP